MENVWEKLFLFLALFCMIILLQITSMKQTVLDRDQMIAQLREDMSESQQQYTACYDEVSNGHIIKWM